MISNPSWTQVQFKIPCLLIHLFSGWIPQLPHVFLVWIQPGSSHNSKPKASPSTATWKWVKISVNSWSSWKCMPPKSGFAPPLFFWMKTTAGKTGFQCVVDPFGSDFLKNSFRVKCKGRSSSCTYSDWTLIKLNALPKLSSLRNTARNPKTVDFTMPTKLGR